MNSAERLEILGRLERGEITPAEAERLLTSEKPRPTSRIDILNQLERGEITTDQAAEQLGGLGESEPETYTRTEHKTVVIDDTRFNPERTWGWWLLPIAGGVVLTVLAGLWMSSSLVRNGALSFGFVCAWFPLAFGLLLVVIGWAIRNGHWLHLRVSSNKPGRQLNLNVDVPAPTQLLTGLMEGFGIRIPGVDKESVDKIVDAIHEGKNNGNPIHIEAHDDHDDDSVDIVIS